MAYITTPSLFSSRVRTWAPCARPIVGEVCQHTRERRRTTLEKTSFRLIEKLARLPSLGCLTAAGGQEICSQKRGFGGEAAANQASGSLSHNQCQMLPNGNGVQPIIEKIRISAQAGFRNFRISRCKCNVDKALPR